MSQRRRTFRIVPRAFALLGLALITASACGDGDGGAQGGSSGDASGDSGSGGRAAGGDMSPGAAGLEAGQTQGGGSGAAVDAAAGGATGGGASDRAGGENGGASGGAEHGASGASAGEGGIDGGGITSVRGIVAAFRPNLANLEERVAGALVTLEAGSERYEAVSDGNGMFEFTAIQPEIRYRVNVSVGAAARRFHDGLPYGDWHGEVTALAGQTTSLMPMLNLGCAIDTTVAASSETTFTTSGNHGCSAYDLAGQLVVPVGGLTRANGEEFSGGARLEFSPIWFPTVASGNVNFTSLAAMPPLVGVPQGETRLEPMHTFAAADLRVTDVASGEPLMLKPGTVARVTLRGFRELTSEDDYSSWSFDPASGAWREEGACTADSEDAQLIHCEVKHFSWWNADGRAPASGGGGSPLGTRCIFGGVLYRGEPLVGASVLATGNAGIVGAAQARTDENGAFCATGVSGNGAWDVQVRVENGREILSQTLSVSPGGVFGGDCSQPDSCSQAGVIELEASPAITVYGRLGLQVGNEGRPMPRGGFSFGRRVRAIGSPDEFGFIQLNLGEVSLDSEGRYEFDIPEAIVRIFFVSPDDGECKTYPSPVPGEGERVEIADQFFICGS